VVILKLQSPKRVSPGPSILKLSKIFRKYILLIAANCLKAKWSEIHYYFGDYIKKNWKFISN